MSRFSGPQQRGAGRQLAAIRRAEAEQRQAAEREWYARRAAEQAAPPRPLTDRERRDFILAVGALNAAEMLRDLRRLRGAA